MVMLRNSFVFLIAVVAVVFSVNALAADASLGKELYQTYCWQCHGMKGDGNGVNVRDMSVQPRDHTNSKEMASRSDEELFKAIKEGGQAISKSVLMPPWRGNLTDEEIHALVNYLRVLCQCHHGIG
jgi:cytochrome c oxidase cbb3-type subunit 3